MSNDKYHIICQQTTHDGDVQIRGTLNSKLNDKYSVVISSYSNSNDGIVLDASMFFVDIIAQLDVFTIVITPLAVSKDEFGEPEVTQYDEDALTFHCDDKNTFVVTLSINDVLYIDAVDDDGNVFELGKCEPHIKKPRLSLSNILQITEPLYQKGGNNDE